MVYLLITIFDLSGAKGLTVSIDGRGTVQDQGLEYAQERKIKHTKER